MPSEEEEEASVAAGKVLVTNARLALVVSFLPKERAG